MKLPYHTLSLALALVLPGIASAEQAPTELDDVVVTATRTPVSIADSVVPVQVIDREQIDRSQAGSLLDLLRGRAGLDFVNQGGPGKITSLFMRGSASSQVLVLVDGVRIGAASSGMPALQDLPIDQIERVEIVRGPRSSLYGSEAIGGVIQIFTRAAGQGLQQNLALTAGSHNLRQASAGFSNRGERGWVSAQGAWQKTDGINACNGSATLFQGCYVDEPDRDGYRNTSLNVRGGYALGETLSVEGHMLDAASRNQYDGSIYGGNEADNQQRVYGGKLRWTPGDAFGLSVQVGRNDDQADSYYVQAGKRSFVSTFDTRRDTASVQGDFLFAEGQQLSVGGDWQKDQVTSTTAYSIDNRDNTGVFAEYQGRFGAHSLQASVRNDDNEQFGNHTTGSLGYGFGFDNGLKLTASVATGFKAPSFNDLYYPGFGNPYLKPEESESINLGIARYADTWNWTFNVYQNKVDQLISYDSQIFLPNNIDEARIRGAEFTVDFTLAGFDIATQLSHTDPRNRSAGPNHDNLLARRPRNTARIDVDRAFGDIRTGLTFNAAGERYDNLANTDRLGGYSTLDLRLEYAIAPAWTLQAKMGNVFDRDYETVAWYNQAGRTYGLSLRYQPTE